MNAHIILIFCYLKTVFFSKNFYLLAFDLLYFQPTVVNVFHHFFLTWTMGIFNYFYYLQNVSVLDLKPQTKIPD